MKEKENMEENKKKKSKKKLKIDLMSINYFYMFFQSHLTYFHSLYKDKIILKCINF